MVNKPVHLNHQIILTKIVIGYRKAVEVQTNSDGIDMVMLIFFGGGNGLPCLLDGCVNHIALNPYFLSVQAVSDSIECS